MIQTYQVIGFLQVPGIQQYFVDMSSMYIIPKIVFLVFSGNTVHLQEM